MRTTSKRSESAELFHSIFFSREGNTFKRGFLHFKNTFPEKREGEKKKKGDRWKQKRDERVELGGQGEGGPERSCHDQRNFAVMPYPLNSAFFFILLLLFHTKTPSFLQEGSARVVWWLTVKQKKKIP
jgi:hypothetical protein